MKHTPTPWRVGRPGTVVSDSADGLTINGATGADNVEYYGGNLIAESVSEENAAFIVRAVNFYTAPMRFWNWLKNFKLLDVG